MFGAAWTGVEESIARASSVHLRIMMTSATKEDSDGLNSRSRNTNVPGSRPHQQDRRERVSALNMNTCTWKFTFLQAIHDACISSQHTSEMWLLTSSCALQFKFLPRTQMPNSKTTRVINLPSQQTPFRNRLNVIRTTPSMSLYSGSVWIWKQQRCG